MDAILLTGCGSFTSPLLSFFPEGFPCDTEFVGQFLLTVTMLEAGDEGTDVLFDGKFLAQRLVDEGVLPLYAVRKV